LLKASKARKNKNLSPMVKLFGDKFTSPQAICIKNSNEFLEKVNARSSILVLSHNLPLTI